MKSSSEAEPDPELEVTQRADPVKSKTTMPRIAGGFKLPSSSLLHRSDDQQVVDADELKLLAQILVEKYAEFGVHGQVTQINPGPVVTTFEFKPEAGIKYSRITNLTDDLCLALKAESILVERMAGKSTVGIQVPNREREIIWLRENIESHEFMGNKSKLTLALGKDINGRISTADLAGMPHLLIAGSTGAGKSVALNAMIMSILYKSTPDQVRMILVDPKRLELGNYEDIPHLYTPIITEPKLAANALRNAVREMERRLKLLAGKGVRNIDQYNKLFDRRGHPQPVRRQSEDRPLPYMVIIIDELADLMMLDSSKWKSRSLGWPRWRALSAFISYWQHSALPLTLSPDLSKPTSPRVFHSGSLLRLTRARFSTPMALRLCWAKATCCTCRRDQPGYIACMHRLLRRRKSLQWSSSGVPRVPPNTNRNSSKPPKKTGNPGKMAKATMSTKTTTIPYTTMEFDWCSSSAKPPLPCCNAAYGSGMEGPLI